MLGIGPDPGEKTRPHSVHPVQADEVQTLLCGHSALVEEHDLLVGEDHAVVLSRWHTTRGSETTTLDHVIVYHLSGDQISEIWIIPEGSEKDAAFLS